jgi:enoyl-CoA hydratase
MRADYGLHYVDVDVEGGVAVVRILDPNDEFFVERSHPMHRDLRDVFPRLADDDDVAAVVLGGGYEYFFPAPRLPQLAELLAKDPAAAARMQNEARQIVVNMIDLSKPLVAAVAGSAIGMGAQLAFLADFLVASRDASFTDTHVPVGLASGDGATVVWPLLLGLARARRPVLRGDPQRAAEAESLGLVAKLVDARDDVLPAARTLAMELAALPREAYRSTKIALNQWLKLGVQVTLELAAALEVSTFRSPEFQRLLDAHAPQERHD